MKKILKIFLLISLLFSGFYASNLAYAENIEGLNKELKTSKNYKKISHKTDIPESTKDIVYRIIDIVRIVFSGILVIFIVYAGAQMIMSKGSEEEELTKAKRTLRYALVGIVFINFPIDIYNGLTNSKNSGNFFIVGSIFKKVVENIVLFLEIIIAGIAIFMIVLTGIKLITSRAREEKISEAKNKLTWIIVALIFIGFIEVWKNFIIAENGLDVSFGVDIFQRLANLALYLAAPVALFFLTLAGYYYITASGDEERAKKGKSIVVNMLIGVIILLCGYVLLNDLSLLTI